MELSRDNWDMIRMFLNEMYQGLSLKNKILLHDNFGVDSLTDILSRCEILDFEEDCVKDIEDLTDEELKKQFFICKREMECRIFNLESDL